jgi:hypothetical protein
MERLKKVLKITVINIVVLVLVLEVLGLVIYFFKKGAFFYAHKRDVPALLEFDETPGAQLTNKRFHPFFGYTFKAGLKNTNNYGFDSPYDFPFEKISPNQYIIGIFGGSVAEDFYEEGRERLTERLKAHPFFADKEIIYLNFALGGYKQPQQMQILTYFLGAGQQIDMAINIDGFNEMIFCSNNNRLNVDIGMPSAQHFLPMRDLMDARSMTVEKMEVIANIQRYKRKYNAGVDTLKNTPFASIYMIYSAYSRFLHGKYQRETVRFDRLIKPAPSKAVDSLVNLKTTPGISDERLLMERIVSFWARCSGMMNRVMQGRGRYFHFLQPNQYYSQKVFTPEEQKTAISEQSPYNYLVKQGYPLLLKKQEQLKQEGLNVFSAATLFDGVKETMFIDNCCHFNRSGHEKFADFVANRIQDSF